MSMRLLLGNVSKFSSVRYASSATSSAYEVLKNNGEESNLSSLKIGFRVASHSNNKSVATVGVWIDSGSRYENADNNGVASLFEHLMYSGTSKRDAQRLQTRLAKLGASLNSITNRDHTAYYVECLSGDVEKVVEMLADVIQNTNFSSSQIEEQRSNLLAKIEEQDSDFRGTVMDNLHKTAFQGNSYSLTSLGSKSTVESLTKKDVENFVATYYKGSRMVLTGVGGVSHDQLTRLSEKHFSGVNNEYARKIPDPRAQVGVRFTGSELMYRSDNYPYLFGAIAVESVPKINKDYFETKMTIFDNVQIWELNAGANDTEYGTHQIEIIAGRPKSLETDAACTFEEEFQNDMYEAFKTDDSTTLRVIDDIGHGLLLKFPNEGRANAFDQEWNADSDGSSSSHGGGSAEEEGPAAEQIEDEHSSGDDQIDDEDSNADEQQ